MAASGVGQEVQAAFRAGLNGACWDEAGPLPDPSEPLIPSGRCQAIMVGTGRMAGLADARPALSTGRALRRIGWLLDQVRMPPMVAEQFRDNVAGAVMTHRMRGRSEPWGAAETIAMFLELYASVLGDDDEARARLGAALLAYAEAVEPGAGLRSWPASP